ncbi:hypothetical protein CEXT_149011 [Caerostris extrusa]|uniref:Uncharacterized protein n=1 Tax=Caerostris extrusa TaxID=172846 RepID=A0AAV4Y7M2_CAEEX|nr:hypothetical protein CEXT_149011 [Caerostris extrusa]
MKHLNSLRVRSGELKRKIELPVRKRPLQNVPLGNDINLLGTYGVRKLGDRKTPSLIPGCGVWRRFLNGSSSLEKVPEKKLKNATTLCVVIVHEASSGNMINHIRWSVKLPVLK